MLSDAQRKYLRRLGHELNPVVLIGNSGLSPNLITEMDGALAHHELVKVRARVGDRDARDEMLARLATATRAEQVQRIGHVALFYRANPEKTKRILLPDG
jgi:RNA-binding protein